MTTATMAPAGATTSARPSVRRATAEAAVLAAAANAFLYLFGARGDAFPQSVLIPGANAPITLARVAIVTMLGVGAGGATLALLRRWSARPWTQFRRVALAVLLLSYTQPSLVLRDAPLRMVVGLNLMHTLAAVIAVALLGRAARPDAR